jgi:hypothetical protein
VIQYQYSIKILAAGHPASNPSLSAIKVSSRLSSIMMKAFYILRGHTVAPNYVVMYLAPNLTFAVFPDKKVY